jgi:hypothetical protein
MTRKLEPPAIVPQVTPCGIAKGLQHPFVRRFQAQGRMIPLPGELKIERTRAVELPQRPQFRTVSPHPQPQGSGSRRIEQRFYNHENCGLLLLNGSGQNARREIRMYDSEGKEAKEAPILGVDHGPEISTIPDSYDLWSPALGQRSKKELWRDKRIAANGGSFRGS